MQFVIKFAVGYVAGRYLYKWVDGTLKPMMQRAWAEAAEEHEAREKASAR